MSSHVCSTHSCLNPFSSLFSQKTRVLPPVPSIWVVSSTLPCLLPASALCPHQEAHSQFIFLVSILGQAGMVSDFITIARMINHSALPGTPLGFISVLV
jgi:hypothetical protein